MNLQKLGMVCVIAGALTAAAYANNISSEEFVKKASIANQFEIESSQLALKRSKNTDVKEFAQQMVDQHSSTANKMKEVILSSNLKITPEKSLDNKHKKLLGILQQEPDNSFDSKYVSIQIDAHHEAVNLFSGYYRHSKDEALKEFSSETLPTLKEHLDHVQDLKEKL